jgi:glycosyltransferase involved in cell wall biosynthesis
MNLHPLKITLLIPTLNEFEAAQKIMPHVKQEWVDQIIFVDGGSTDGTVEWAQAQGYEVWVQKKPGFRNAYLEVWPQIRGDIVITFSPDGNSIPEVIPQLIGKIKEGYDLVIASRYLDQARSADDDFVTAFGNWVFRTLANLFLRPSASPRMTDIMVIYRAFRKDLPSRLGLDRPEFYEDLERLFKTHVDWTPLMSMRALKWGIKWSEIPADEPPRIGGERKLRIFQWGAIFLIQLLREACRIPLLAPAGRQ